MQNKLGDLLSLVKFLRISPSSDQQNFLKEYITDPLKNYEQGGIENLRLLMDDICLRRSKEIIKLPERHDIEREIELTPDERSEYAKIKDEAMKLIASALGTAKAGKSFCNILQVILKLRLFCSMGTSAQAQAAVGEDVLSAFQEAGQASCIKCEADVESFEGDTGGYLTVCSHVFCCDCFPEFEASLPPRQAKKQVLCPICGDSLPKEYLAKGPKSRNPPKKRTGQAPKPLSPLGPQGEPPSKIRALVEALMPTAPSYEHQEKR